MYFGCSSRGWQFIGGGGGKDGEEPFDTALREAAEEYFGEKKLSERDWKLEVNFFLTLEFFF